MKIKSIFEGKATKCNKFLIQMFRFKIFVLLLNKFYWNKIEHTSNDK